MHSRFLCSFFDLVIKLIKRGNSDTFQQYVCYVLIRRRKLWTTRTAAGALLLTLWSQRSLQQAWNKCVSETIWMAPLAKAHSALGKQNVRSIERRYQSITEILWRTASTRKLPLKLGNLLLSYDQKRLLIWRPSAILNFPNSEFKSHDLCHHAILLPCAKFHWNQTISCWVVAKNDFRVPAVHHVELKKFHMCSSGCHWVPVVYEISL